MLSPLAAEHVHNPRNVGPLEGATHQAACGSPGDGPYVVIWLEVEDEKIMRAAYSTHGCPSSVAASSMACQIATGRTLAQARLLTGDDLLLILGGLPEGKERFAHMAAKALLNATENINA